MLKHISAILSVVLCCGSCASLADESISADYLANYAVKWEQAKSSYANCQATQHIQQKHLLLGDCPTTNAIHLYYLTSALMHLTAAELLPARYAESLKNSDLLVNISFYRSYSQVGVSYQF